MLRDQDSGEPLYGLIRLTAVGGDEKPLRLAELAERPMGWFSAPSRCTIDVPQTTIRLEAIHGIETGVTRKTIDLAGKTRLEVTLSLKRFYDPGDKGIRCANTHLHLFLDQHKKMGVLLRSREEADRYVETASHSDGLVPAQMF